MQGIKCGMEVGLASPNNKKMVAMGNVQRTDSKAKGSGYWLIVSGTNQCCFQPNDHVALCAWEDPKVRDCHCLLYSMALRKCMVSTLALSCFI
jgi:hypothetical protein